MYFKTKLILFLKTDMDENGLNRKKGAWVYILWHYFLSLKEYNS